MANVYKHLMNISHLLYITFVGQIFQLKNNSITPAMQKF